MGRRLLVWERLLGLLELLQSTIRESLMIGIMLLTYKRIDYARKTLEALGWKLEPGEAARIHIADDGSSEEHREELFDLAHTISWASFVTMSNSERGGYGANFNAGTQALHSDCDLILPIEDDWVLEKHLALGPLAKILREDERVNCIRLGYIGFTQDLRGSFISTGGSLSLLLDPDSPEPHVFAGHPRLETRDFERRVGEWPTGLLAGATEVEVAARPEARKGVIWPADLVHPRGDLFAHIGTQPSDEPIWEEVENVS